METCMEMENEKKKEKSKTPAVLGVRNPNEKLYGQMSSLLLRGFTLSIKELMSSCNKRKERCHMLIPYLVSYVFSVVFF